jgi:hypothetical protein
MPLVWVRKSLSDESVLTVIFLLFENSSEQALF